MRYEDYIGIETPIQYKFQNKMIPELVDVIKNYLFKYPNKVKFYLDKTITLEGVLQYLSSNPKLLSNTDIEPKDLLEVIQEFVEKKYVD